MPFWLKDTQSKIFVWVIAAVAVEPKVAVGPPCAWPVLQLIPVLLRSSHPVLLVILLDLVWSVVW